MTRRVSPWLRTGHRTNLIRPFDVVPYQLVDAAKRMFTRLWVPKPQALNGSTAAYPPGVAADGPAGV
jgi:hypothetical protein